MSSKEEIRELDESTKYYDSLRFARLRRNRIRGVMTPFLLSETAQEFLKSDPGLGDEIQKKFGRGVNCERVINILQLIKAKEGMSVEELMQKLFLEYIESPNNRIKKNCKEFVEVVTNELNHMGLIKKKNKGFELDIDI